MSANTSRNQWLDLCRALAVSLVVLSHGFELLRNPAIVPIQSLFGAMGVEIFFCLSGFLIGSIFIRVIQNFDGSAATLLNFMGRRWMRTLPNYYFYLAINVWLFWAGWTTVKELNLTPYFFFVQNLLWPHPQFFGEAWSLAVEEVFYLLLPLTFFAAWFLMRKSMPALITALVTLLTVSMALRYQTAISDAPWDAYIRKIAILRIDSLMWGVLLAVLHWYLDSKHKAVLRIIGLLMLCFLPVSILSLTVGMPGMTPFVFRFLGLTFASIGVCGLISLGLRARLPRSVVSVTGRLSKWSYSMYLANMPTYYLFLNYVEPNIKFSSFAIEFCCYLVTVIAASIVTYTVIEKPFLALRDRYLPDSRDTRRGTSQDATARAQ